MKSVFFRLITLLEVERDREEETLVRSCRTRSKHTVPTIDTNLLESFLPLLRPFLLFSSSTTMAGLVNDRPYGKTNRERDARCESDRKKEERELCWFSPSARPLCLSSSLTPAQTDASCVFEVPANIDHEGYIESENALFKHVAIRDKEKDSKYVPNTANIAPR